MRISASLDGKPVAASKPFNVCAHPAGFKFVQDGDLRGRKVQIHVVPPGGGEATLIEPFVWGTVYKAIVSGDGIPAGAGTLDQAWGIEDVEVVAVAGSPTGYFMGLPFRENPSFTPLAGFGSDLHVQGDADLTTFLGKIDAIQNGQPGTGNPIPNDETIQGHVIYQQHFVFGCRRCDIPFDDKKRNESPKVPASGFHIEFYVTRKQKPQPPNQPNAPPQFSHFLYVLKSGQTVGPVGQGVVEKQTQPFHKVTINE